MYTVGRLSRAEHLPALAPGSSEDLGVDVHETDRGGQVTYHGPGQLVAYGVLDLREWGGPLKYVRSLERIGIETLADFDIDAGVVERGHRGLGRGGQDCRHRAEN